MERSGNWCRVLTFFNAVFLGSARVAVFLCACDTLNALVEVVLEGSACLGVGAVCLVNLLADWSCYIFDELSVDCSPHDLIVMDMQRCTFASDSRL